MFMEAAEWLRLMFVKGSATGEANYLMGLLYEEGKGVDLNLHHAFNYFK